MRSIRTSLLLGAGVILVLLLKLDVIRPAEWFLGAPDAPAVVPAPVGMATTDDPPAFAMLTSLNRTQDGFYVSRAGKTVREARLLNHLIDGLNASLRLPRTIYILIKPCGEVGAYYDPAAAQIVFCDEFFHFEEQIFSRYYTDQAAFDQAVLGATTFILFHEIGHALVHQLDLPVLGRGEDAADQIATYLLTASGASEQAFHGGEFFAYMASDHLPGDRFPYWDVHGLNEQRFYNVSCWLYGHDPGRFGFLITSNALPQDRARDCAAESAENARAVARHLLPHLKQ